MKPAGPVGQTPGRDAAMLPPMNRARLPSTQIECELVVADLPERVFEPLRIRRWHDRSGPRPQADCAVIEREPDRQVLVAMPSASDCATCAMRSRTARA